MSLANTDTPAAPRTALWQGFQTTRRSVLLRAKEHDQRALSTLCEVYWHPVYAFVRAHGVNRDLALDITQGVFHNLLRRDLRTLDLERGSRFRNWLKRVTRSHLLNVLKSSRRVSHVEIAGEPTQGADTDGWPSADIAKQDQLFDQRTAMALIDRAWERLRREKYAAQGTLFEHVRQSLSAEATRMTDSELSRHLGQCDCYVRAVRKRVKDQEFPEAMRAELRSVGVSERRLDEELRALCEALA